MASIVTDFLNTDIINKPYYVHAKRDYLKHQLLISAKAGQDVYENEYNKLNNLPYALKENGHISIKKYLEIIGMILKTIIFQLISQ
ncbi:MAG: hypothetical protein IJA65_05950 [Acholeplasmatales bacterium]|nr:hypothetical protein [Acholeplasmatales bacterium]